MFVVDMNQFLVPQVPLGLVPKEGFEPTHPCGYYVLNVARLPFRHFGIETLVAVE